MNEKNLIPQNLRPLRERKEIARKGAIKSNEVQKKKKEEAKQNEKVVDILKKVIFSEVKSEVVKKKIKELGIEGSNYFTALCAVSTTKAMQKGDFNVIFKIIELIDKSNLNSFQTEESESFNNLIGAIKNVRKIEPESE